MGKKMDKLKEKILIMFVTMLLERLDPETIKDLASSGLKVVREKVMETSSKYDDLLVLPLIDAVETAFNIPKEDN